MTAYSTKGSIMQAVIESTFGVDPGAGYEDVRMEGNPTISGELTNSVQSETLHANPNQSEKPTLVNTPVEGAVSFNMLIRRAAVDGEDAFLVKALKSAGWVESSASADTTIATATSATETIFSADVGLAGRGHVVELDDGKMWPILSSAYTGGGTDTANWACALPSAATAGNAVYKCHTLTPGAVGAVTTSLTLRNILKAKSGANFVAPVYTGASLSAISPATFTPGQKAILNLTFNVAGHNGDNTVASFPANDFLDSEKAKPIDQTWVQFANASSSGEIASATVKVIDWIVDPGHTTKQIPGIGDATCIHNVQANRQDPGPIVITLKFLYDSDRIADWEGAVNTSKYIGIVQPTTDIDNGPFAFISPNAHIMEMPATSHYDEEHHLVTIKYKCEPAGYNSETDEADQANQPLYILLGTEA